MDSNTSRCNRTSISVVLEIDVKRDLDDLKSVTGITRSELVRRALAELIRQKIRWIKPSSDSAKRLLARYKSTEV